MTEKPIMTKRDIENWRWSDSMAQNKERIVRDFGVDYAALPKPMRVDEPAGPAAPVSESRFVEVTQGREERSDDGYSSGPAAPQTPIQQAREFLLEHREYIPNDDEGPEIERRMLARAVEILGEVSAQPSRASSPSPAAPQTPREDEIELRGFAIYQIVAHEKGGIRWQRVIPDIRVYLASSPSPSANFMQVVPGSSRCIRCDWTSTGLSGAVEQAAIRAHIDSHAAPSPSAALRELVEDLTRQAEVCKLSGDPRQWSVAFGIERARDQLATHLLLGSTESP